MKFTNEQGGLSPIKVIAAGVAALIAVVALIVIWPFYSVPTGSRGVVTQFGALWAGAMVMRYTDWFSISFAAFISQLVGMAWGAVLAIYGRFPFGKSTP